jgi:hypothetical protein
VNRSKSLSRQLFRPRTVRHSILGSSTVAVLVLSVLFCAFSASAQSQKPPVAPGPSPSAAQQQPNPEPSEKLGQQAAQQPDQPSPGTITGTVVDSSGATIAGAHVILTRDGTSPAQEAQAGEAGGFSFVNVAPGPLQLTVTSEGFATQRTPGILHPGEILTLPPIVLTVATEVTQIQVVLPRVELAEEELKVEEKQRVFGVIPNFYVSYVANAAPLAPRQKFQLAWRSTIDPVNFVVIGAFAGIEQANNTWSGYGQGAQGYAKRYGAAYTDFVTSTFIGSAILPSILKQDPRYFYKGTGTVRQRVLYAIANSVICKGDNGHWQANYSSILGSLASGGISNLYYPSQNRNGAALTFENTLIGIGETAATNILQEFVIRKLTPNLPHQQSATP